MPAFVGPGPSFIPITRQALGPTAGSPINTVLWAQNTLDNKMGPKNLPIFVACSFINVEIMPQI
jgi:hypothetical protein